MARSWSLLRQEVLQHVRQHGQHDVESINDGLRALAHRLGYLAGQALRRIIGSQFPGTLIRRTAIDRTDARGLSGRSAPAPRPEPPPLPSSHGSENTAKTAPRP